MTDLSGKIALVTGASRGIGRAIAVALARAGTDVAVNYRNRETDARETADLIAALGRRGLVVAADVSVAAEVTRLVAEVEAGLGPIDILVNSAGINIKNRMMGNMPPEEWDRVLAVNATGVYNCMHAVLPQMRERKDGLIVNISSISGKRAAALGGVAYNASKFAVAALGTSVANEEGPNYIRITNIYPGEVDTPILEFRPQPVNAERRAKMLLPEDVADLVVAIAKLPPRAHVPELVIKPTSQAFI